MATLTPKLGLRKPSGPDLVNVTADISDNMDILDKLGRVAVRLGRNAGQAITANTQSFISWDTENEDTDGLITVPSTTITVPANLGGLYAITLNVLCNQACGTTERMYVALGVVSESFLQPVGSGEVYGTVSVVYRVDAGQTVSASFFKQTGTGITITASLQMVRVSL